MKPRLSIGGIASAVPDVAIAGTFLLTWLVPRSMSDRMVGYLMMTMLLEFIIVHSAAFMGLVMVGDLSRVRKTGSIVGLGAFYSVFVVAFAAGSDNWWAVRAFWLLIANRLMPVLFGEAPVGAEKEYVQSSWVRSVLFYLVFVFATIFLPIPALGITPAVIDAQHLWGSGLWVDEPYRVIAFGFLYFSAQAAAELYGSAQPAGAALSTGRN